MATNVSAEEILAAVNDVQAEAVDFLKTIVSIVRVKSNRQSTII